MAMTRCTAIGVSKIALPFRILVPGSMWWIAAISCVALAAVGKPAFASPIAEPIAAGGGFAARGIADCRTDLRKLNQLSGWQVRWPQDWAELSAAPDDEIRAALLRWEAVPSVLGADMEALKEPSAARAPQSIARRVLAQVDQLSHQLEKGAPALPANAAPDLLQRWERLFSNTIRPAVNEYRSFLKDQYRPSGDFGLAAVPGGRDCFRRAVATFSTADLEVEDLERIGWRVLRASEGDLLGLYGLKRRNLPDLMNKLRQHSEPEFDAGKLLSLSESAIRRAILAVPRMFVRTKVAPIVVRPVPKQMEASFTAAAYHGSHAADEPAVFALNLSRPLERRLTAEAIAFHETVPGHHAAEGLGYPFGRPNSGFLEGWGMYAEQLAGEMDLYSSRLDEAGMLVRRISAAVRPIVETGVHVRGWPRSRAVEFMRAHTALSEADIELELDRLLAGPGQPSSYIIGYDRFISLRTKAQASLRGQFNLREFHDQVLAKGARPLAELEADLESWILEQNTRRGR